MRTRLLSWICLLAMAGAVVRPAPAHAIPVIDWESFKENGIQFAERMADWYLQAKVWRDTAKKRADALINRTRGLTRLREKYESMAQGELGRLGNAVPDWRDYSNFCAVEKDGTTVCNADDQLMARYEGIIQQTVVQYRDSVFSKWDMAEDSVNSIIFGQLKAGTNRIDQEIMKTAHHRMIASHPLIVAQAQRGGRLDAAALNLQAQIDSIKQMELEGKEISSGRAAQLNASLAYVSALVNLEVARNKLEALQLASAQTAAGVLDYRFTAYSDAHASSRW